MFDWLWRSLEPRIQGVVTDRLVTFYEALIERREITRGHSTLPLADCSHRLAEMPPASL